MQKRNVEKLKNGKHYKQLIDEGYIPFTPEWAKRVKYLNSRWDRKNPAQRKQHLESAKKRYHLNLEENRKKEREKKREQRKKRKEEINKNQKRNYHKDRESNAEKQRVRRYRREPHRAIRTYTDLYLQGLLTYEQYIESINEYTSRAEQLEYAAIREGEESGK